jgi:hypothetical protein
MKSLRIPHRIARRALPGLLPLLAAALLSCQSPTETPPMVRHRVLVHVVDSTQRPIPTLPVELYRGGGATREPAPLQTRVTDGAGNALFEVEIPSTGAPFTLVAGDDNFGRMTVEANLLCRDTAMVIAFVLRNVPCNETRSDALVLPDICMYNGGRGMSDSGQAYYRSGCAVPLTMTCTPVDDPFRLRVFVVDAAGREVTGSTFTLPPAGFFAVRAVAAPRDTGRIVRTVTISGTGSGGASLQVTLTVEAHAVPCEGCPCDGDTLTLDFPLTEAYPTPRSVVLPFTVLTNRGLCDRRDRLLRGPRLTDIFALDQPLRETVRPGEAQTLQLSFRPKEARAYTDTLVIEHFIPDNNRLCTSMIILRAEGCGPVCVFERGALDSTGTPDSYVARLRARVYQSDQTLICVRNAGRCGELVLRQGIQPPLLGFFSFPTERRLQPNERDCFTAGFNASDSVVWPNGHGRPAVVHFENVLTVTGSGADKRIRLLADVDTIPILFSRCIYEWQDNQHLGYNFTPPELKGSEINDPDPVTRQVTDLVVDQVTDGVGATVRLRSGWRQIRCNVTEGDFVFSAVASWPEYRSITAGPFDTSAQTSFRLGCVYSVRIERGGVYSYALVRVRECSSDADGKHKMCLDVLYPMIRE